MGGKPNSESKRILNYLERGVVLDKKNYIIEFFKNIVDHKGAFNYDKEKTLNFHINSKVKNLKNF